MLVRPNRFYRTLWVIGFLLVSGSVIGVQVWRQRSEASALTQVSTVPSFVPVFDGASLVQGVSDPVRIPSVIIWSTTESPDAAVKQYQLQWQQAGWTSGDVSTADSAVGFESVYGQGRVQVLSYRTNGQTLVTVTIFHSL